MPVFLFSDIEGSTKKWEQYKEQMPNALALHDEILQRNIIKYGGSIIKHTGDGVFAVFEEGNPIECAISIQKEIADTDWGAIGELRVRIALHAGYAEKRKNDYFGPVINRTARILGVAWGGQILITPEVLNSYSLPANAAVKDLGRHMLKDLGEPQLIYCLLSPELKIQEFPPLRSLSAHPNNLPIQVTPFLGREKELSEIEQLLQIPSCRLLTIIGPGGIGKSRLALQVAADMIESFPDGTFLVPLAPLTSAQFLVSAIADQIKFSFYSRQEPRMQLLGYLAEKQMLLILDNFEHIIEGATIISEILRTAPKVKIIVTSREMLNLQGEYLYQIKGLEYPTGEKVDTGKFGAVQLFLQNARRIKIDFSPSEEEVNYIVRICQIVGGMPLGIELASSWLRILSLTEITKEMERNLDFLSSKMRDIPERQQSLRAVFEYSWKLLNSEEKNLLARLSVFPRKFSRSAAEKIAGATLPLLSSLMDKSLLSRDASGYYEMIGILRQYAEEKLQEIPEQRVRTYNLFNEYYANFIDSAKEELITGTDVESIAEIKKEMDNIRVAWSAIVERGDIRLIEKALAGIFYIYDNNGWLKEGVDTLQRIIDRLTREGRKDLETELIGKVYSRQATFLYQLGFYDRARELLNLSLEIARKNENKEEMGVCINTLGNIAFMLSQYDEAQKMYNAWLEIAQSLNHEKNVAGAYNNLGVISYQLGEYNRAKELFEKSKSIAEKIGYKKGVAFTKSNIALILNETGNYEEAKRIFMEALDFDRQIDDKISIADTLNNLGLVHKALKEIDEAQKTFEESWKIRQEIGDRMGLSVSFSNLGDIAVIRKRYDEALKFFEDARMISRELNDKHSEMVTYLKTGGVYADLKDYTSAKRDYLRVLDFVKEFDYSDIINQIFYRCAVIIDSTSSKRLALELVCFVIASEKKDKELLNLVEELFINLSKGLSKQKVAAIQKKAKITKPEEYIDRITKLFSD
uniref:Adenylate/guanylate cyclase domain-containing protein n=1 Tax=candidate division WOR-3 bacterium TaxID=2052148 RepID=A0A7C4XK16_UNCW3